MLTYRREKTQKSASRLALELELDKDYTNKIRKRIPGKCLESFLFS